MKKMVKTALVTGIVLIGANSFAQTTNSGSEENGEGKKTENTYFDIVLNLVSTNLNYGGFKCCLNRL